MTQQLLIGNVSKGLTLDRLPFVIDNDSFPTLFNFYAWRGRLKKKRGTILLARLELQVESHADPDPWQVEPLLTLDGSGNGTVNLFSLLGLGDSTLAPNSFELTDGTNIYTEPASADGTLVGIVGGSGTINYSTGILTITGGAPGGIVVGNFSYFPLLPVMGLRNFINSIATANYPLLIAFDTRKAYQLNQVGTPFFYNISFYKNTNNPVTWTGKDFQQFWTTNYSGAFWATNNTPGFQFKNISSWDHTSNAIEVTNHNLVIDDQIWISEATVVPSVNGQTYTVLTVPDQDHVTVTGGFGVANPTGGIAVYLTNIAYVAKDITAITQAANAQVTIAGHSLIAGNKILFRNVGGMTQINELTGVVQTVVGPNDVTVNIDSTLFTAYGADGVAIFLDASSRDGIRWYDGDPTSDPILGGTGLPTGTGLGWVNFSPPLSAAAFSINNLPADIYYLVGALFIVPYKDRLLFFKPWVQTSTGGAIQLEDVVIWSWNGTPYYNSVVPVNQTFDISAYYEDVTGKGGFLAGGITQAITSVTNNEDVLLVGFSSRQTRLVFTGNDLQPFLFFSINSELGSLCPFSGITLDRGGLTIGNYGILLTTQVETQRIDLQIPDTIFAIKNLDNGAERVNSVRDFFKEWIYFCYSPDNSDYKFPTQTLLYNYREATWAVLYENFTAQGSYRKSSGYTWKTIPFPSWETWREPWNSGTTSALFPSILGGNPQGFVLVKGEGTSESQSGNIASIINNNNNTQITSVDHCVAEGDFLYILGCIGITALNGQIGRVIQIVDKDNFVLDISFPSGTYLGLGTFARLIQPLLQTKQFPAFWQQGKKVRIGVQQYLLDYTANGQVTLYIFLSQNPDTPWNSGPIIPDVNSQNNSLIYSQILFTSPELYIQISTNSSLGSLGDGLLTTLILNYQQIFGFTGEIVPGSVTINIGSPAIAAFADNGTGGFTATGTGVSIGSSIDYEIGIITLVFSVAPNAQASTTSFQYFYNNIQMPTASSQFQIWHRVNTSLIGDTIQLGITLSEDQMKDLDFATSEITLHALQVNFSPGPYLS